MLVQTVKKIRRWEQILLSLNDLTYATQKQLQIINNLGSDRNAHRILHDMEKDKLISSIRMERKIYFLSRNGAEMIGVHYNELKKSEIIHILMRNDMYIKLGMPETWEKERGVQWGNDRLIPDARFVQNGVYHFVEVDHKQQMRTNEEKIKKYKELSDIIFNQYNHHPVLIWYTMSEVRKKKLHDLCSKAGIKFKVY